MGNTRQIVIYFGSFLPITPNTLCAGFLLNRYNAVKTANTSFYTHVSINKRIDCFVCIWQRDRILEAFPNKVYFFVYSRHYDGS